MPREGEHIFGNLEEENKFLFQLLLLDKKYAWNFPNTRRYASQRGFSFRSGRVHDRKEGPWGEIVAKGCRRRAPQALGENSWKRGVKPFIFCQSTFVELSDLNISLLLVMISYKNSIQLREKVLHFSETIYCFKQYIKLKF